MGPNTLCSLFVVALALSLTGCPKGQEGLPENIDGLLDSPPGSSVLLFSVEAHAVSDLAAKVNLVKMRLEAFGIKGTKVDTVKPLSIRVQVPSQDTRLLEKIQELITRPSSISIAPVMTGKSFFKKIESRLKSFKGAWVQKDELGVMRTDRKTKVWFIVTEDSGQMKNILEKLQAPKGTRLMPMRAEHGAMAFLVQYPPPMNNPVITHIRPVLKQDSFGMGVEAKLAKPYWDEFADLVRANLNRPLAIVVNGQVVALPVVGSKIKRGAIQIMPSPLVGDDESQQQAQGLAVQLKSWQMVGMFKLVAKRVSLKK